VVLEEYGDCRPSLWGTVILPTLIDRKGWSIFIGTSKGKNHFYKVHQRAQKEDNWYSLILKASESGIIAEEELLEMKAQMSEAEYAQEMECDFEAAVKGTYYASIIQQMEGLGRIAPGKPLHNPDKPVRVASDLGRTDSTAWWFWQDDPQGPQVIDYYEETDNVVDDVIKMLRSKPYDYDDIWLPFDGKAHTFQTRRSTMEQMLDADFSIKIVPKLSKQHGIDAARLILPTCSINQETCFEGIEALRAYRRLYNELTEQFSDAPYHDWASNGADAFRYMSLVCKASTYYKGEPAPPPLIFKPAEYRLDDLFKDKEKNNTQYEILRM